MLQYSIVQYSNLQYGIIQYIIVQYATLRYTTYQLQEELHLPVARAVHVQVLRHDQPAQGVASRLQCSVVQCSIVQYSVIQYSIVYSIQYIAYYSTVQYVITVYGYSIVQSWSREVASSQGTARPAMSCSSVLLEYVLSLLLLDFY